MKKFVKWFLFSLVVCGSLALAICYMAIPERTKSAVDVVVGYLNTPIGIVSGTTITIGLVVGVILKLVYNRYKLDVKKQLQDYLSKVEELTTQAKNYEEISLNYYNELKSSIDELKVGKEEDYLKLLTKLAEICKTSPNAKIKKIGLNIEKGIEEYGKEREETTNNGTKD